MRCEQAAHVQGFARQTYTVLPLVIGPRAFCLHGTMQPFYLGTQFLLHTEHVAAERGFVSRKQLTFRFMLSRTLLYRVCACPDHSIHRIYEQTNNYRSSSRYTGRG